MADINTIVHMNYTMTHHCAAFINMLRWGGEKPDIWFIALALATEKFEYLKQMEGTGTSNMAFTLLHPTSCRVLNVPSDAYCHVRCVASPSLDRIINFYTQHFSVWSKR